MQLFLCRLTRKTIYDPVILKADGLTYERAAINAWLVYNDTSPVTNAVVNRDVEVFSLDIKMRRNLVKAGLPVRFYSSIMPAGMEDYIPEEVEQMPDTNIYGSKERLACLGKIQRSKLFNKQ